MTQANTIDTDVDVLIVGAGPTGLTLALELCRYPFVTFRIVDRLAVPSGKSRALVLQSRSLELFSRAGVFRDAQSKQTVADELCERGVRSVGLSFFASRREAFKIDFADLGFDDTAYGAPFWLSQADTDALLEERLQACGHKVERDISVAPEDISQSTGSATAVLTRQSDNAKETVRVRYVVGCDGAHSAVRHAAVLPFEGSSYPRHFILCDARLTGPYERGHILFFSRGTRFMLLFPLHGDLVRLIGVRSDHILADDPTLEEFAALVRDVTPPATQARAEWSLSDAVWLAGFKLHRRGVSDYRNGRLFVAGDAAHIHSPAGGQGMNTGIQDAVNLGWKLAAVLSGRRPESFLDTYNAERHPVGRTLLRGTDRLFNFMSDDSFLATLLRNWVIPLVAPWLTADRGRRRRLFRFGSQLGIRYRHTDTVSAAASWRGELRGGSRAPDGALVPVGGGGEQRLYQLLSVSGYTLLLFQGGRGSLPSVESGTWDAEAVRKRVSGLCPWLVDLETVLIGGDSDTNAWLDEDLCLHHYYDMGSSGGFALIRPDAYIAWIGHRSCLNELGDWLEMQASKDAESQGT